MIANWNELVRLRVAAAVFGLRRWTASFFRLCPAFPAVIAIALGIVTVLGVRFWGDPRISWAGLSFFGIFFALRCLGVGLRSGRLVELCWFAVGMSLSQLHLATSGRSYLRVLPRVPCRIEVRGIVSSPVYLGDGLPPTRRGTSSEILVRAVRRPGESAWRGAAGRLLARLPFGAPGLPYGAEVQLEGRLSLPSAAAFPGAFDYRRYLLCDGVRHILTVERAGLLSGPMGWRRPAAALFRVRDRLVDRVIRGTRSTENARLLAAITLGCRQGLNRATRLQFVRSGAVHVFAISGLHVGIFAGLLLLVLRTFRVPFRLRYWFLPLPLAVYVFLTGAHPSGVRAWIMLSLWSWGRAGLLPAAPLNTVALAALVLLVLNPLNLARTGFQFSFTIVVTLILGWPLVSKTAAVIEERALWVPLRFRSAWARFGAVRGVVRLTGAGVLAWLGSGGLVAWTNSLVVPGGFLVNLVVAPLAWGTLFMSGWKLLFSFVPLWRWPEHVAGRFLEAGLVVMRGATALGAKPPLSLAVNRPTVLPVLLYYTLLLAALHPRLRVRARVVFAGGLGMLVLFAWPRLRTPGFDAVAVLGPGGAVPAVAVTWRPQVPPVIVNTGDSRTGRLMAEWLLSHGVRTVDALILAGPAGDTAGGAPALLESLDVRTVVCFRPDRAGPRLERALAEHSRRGGRLRSLPDVARGTVSCSGVDVTRTAQGRECELRIGLPAGGMVSEVRVANRANQGGTAAIRRPGRGRWDELFRGGASLTGRIAVLEPGAVAPVVLSRSTGVPTGRK
ncbi:MAG: DUF4131 domain-containing protein [Kiritimatiellaeota bacterium]|nr:DUF4131 domain-containing protein [Kiritimatiellota bacterium]